MIVLLFILILSVLIVVHEAGHFWMARRTGVRVEQFSLGFGPKLFGWTWQGTEYCLCAIPLGGYVKMAGEERSACKGKQDEYFSKSAGQRALIILMGPAVNYLLAYLCFVVVFMIGFIDLEATNKAIPARVGSVLAGSPAAKAGLKPGDNIQSVNDTATSNWIAMQDLVAGSGAKPLLLVIRRDRQDVRLSVIPEFHQVKDLFGREHPVSRIGIKPPDVPPKEALVVRHYTFGQAWGRAAEELWSITTRTCSALWEIVTRQRSAREGMTGLIGIFMIIKFAAGIGFSFLLHVVGAVSASLAIFNLIPVIPLDGGHLALVALERIRGRGLSPRTEDLIARTGFILIMALAVFVFYLDFERIGLIDRIIGIFHR